MLEENKQDYKNLEQSSGYPDFGANIQDKNQLNKGQKIAAISLAVFAFLIIIFWSLQFNRTLYGTGDSSQSQNTGYQSVDPNDAEAKKQQELMAADTDKDGLSDWDELNTYKTSPYLEDSDGDGYQDKEEIDNDKDPNCPLDRDCYGLGIVDGEKDLVTDTTEEEEQISLPDFQQNLDTSGQNGTDVSGMTEEEILMKIISGEVDAATLRQILISQGMTKEQLDKFSDEQLMENYQATLNSTPAE